MIVHALSLLVSELNTHFNTVYGVDLEDTVALGNIAGIENNAGVENQRLQGKILMTLVNIREEKTLKNGQHSRVNDQTLRTEYFNPPVFVNLFVLFSATTKQYDFALMYISRLVRFFQGRNVFTENNTAPAANIGGPNDQLQSFKLILDLYSPTFEELNHLWGTLGGKQYPSVLYQIRLLELKREEVTAGGGVIQQIDSRFLLSNSSGS